MTPWFSSSPRKSTGTAAASSDADKQKQQVLTVADAVKYMVPPQPTTNIRFSLLLLEFGETLLQDWAVVVTTHQVIADPKGATRAKLTGTANSHSTSTTRTTTAHTKGTKTPWDKSSQGRNHTRRVAPQSTPTTPLSLQGRLHLCTKSLVFEPDEPLRPIWRFPFSKMEAPPSEIGDTLVGKSSLGDSYEIPLSIQFTAIKYWAMKENNTIGPYEMRYSTQVQITFLHSSPPTLIQLCTVRNLSTLFCV